jgi:predicted helicase
MSSTSTVQIKPSHKAIQAYYDALSAYDAQDVEHEMALRSAFQNLLAETARAKNWTLIPELSIKIRGRQIRPDGTLRDDEWQLPRGYWEAKDTADALDDEIRIKVGKGYPLVNTIFEDTRRAVLFQHGQEVFRADLGDRQELTALLTTFFAYSEKDIEGFEQAVAEFQDRIPHLARALLEKIQAAHKKNKKFQGAFDSLLEVCRSSLNPNISIAAVDEMLVQHLMTERLFDRIFSDQDFARRNVIAAEIETVIDALVSQSFNRSEFLKSLDPFYKAIEDAARTIDDFTEKQHFLNSVYERFFQGYSVKVADTHGIVYTPQEIVDFMCASVQEVLKTEFGLGLASPGVHILDPCTGTGNFIVNLMRRVEPRDLPRVYKSQLFANEVMLLPYYIAAQNIEHEYYDRTGTYEPFGGLCFVDTLELAEAEQGVLSFMSEENTARVEREKKAPINVIIGNPPYNVGQLNENDNNKNRKYKVIGRKIADTFAADSTATNKNALSDVYVKFFRWAIDRLQGRDGIVCFVSNNGFLQGIAFDGFRKHLAQEFDLIYHFNFRGNGRALGIQRTLEGRNIFSDQIRVGVGVTMLVRHGRKGQARIFYHAVADRMKAREKKQYLRTFRSLSDVPWRELTSDERHTWLVPENTAEYSELILIGSKAGKAGHDGETIFSVYGRGVATSRDDVVYDFDPGVLTARIERFAEDYNSEVDRYAREGGDVAIDDFVRYDKIKWSRDLKLDLQRQNYARFDESKVREALYRPFCKQHLFFDRILNEEVYVFPRFFPTPETERENRVIVISDIGYRAFSFAVLMTNCIADLHLCASSDSHQCFPFFVYNEDGGNRRENITDWVLGRFRERYDDPAMTKWDIFHYVYGVLHHPAYREKFADNLRRELPRIPFVDDFRAISEAGRRLAELHVGYETVEPCPLRWAYSDSMPLSYRVDKMRLNKDKSALMANESLTLADIPPEAFEYRLGNRSALEWVIDQHQVTTDKRSGITSDPNRPDDPEYIVRLVERVVRVSVETVRIIKRLPAD